MGGHPTEGVGADMDPVPRETARVLPVDQHGRVLLMHGWDPAKPEQPFWFTIGGGLEPGESAVDAAVRELFEETGLHTDALTLGEPFAIHRHQFGWGGTTLLQNEIYFAMAASPAGVSFAGMEQIELETIDRADWWTPDDLERDGSAGFQGLPDFMRMAIQKAAARSVR